MDKNIVFISDENQIYYALTNALMIERQSKKFVKINLIFVDIKDEKKDNINDIISNLKLKYINLIYVNSKDFELGISKIEHITNTTNIRLYLASILKDVDNVLYLDNDVVIDGDINDVFDFLDPNYSYGRPWPRWNGWVKILQIKGLLKSKWYVNAGVLYLNLKFIHENNIEEKLINFLKTKQNKIKFADQDVLNCNIKFVPLPYTWNIARDKWGINRRDIVEKSNLKIYHFLSKNKQWDEDIKKITFKKTKGSLSEKELNRMIEPQKKWKENYNLIKNLIK